MGLILRFGSHPTPRHIADNSLAAFVDVDVFDRDFLLALASVAIQGFQKRGVGAGFSRRPSNVCSPIMARR